MGSEQNDGTSYQPSEPKPCDNNCGFFGTAGNRNLCSKCYRDFCIEEERAASAKAAMEKSLLHPAAAVTAAASATLSTDSTVPAAEASSSSEPQVVALKKAANRCGSCNKKVGLSGFVCKCGNTFCGVHRYPESHECSYDFKGVGRDAISKANPVVKADKMEKF